MGNVTPHTPGPWSYCVDDDDGTNPGIAISNAEWGIIAESGGGPLSVRLANARRIVAAVNICEGIPIEDLERQRTVADGLSRITGLIAAAEEAATLLDEIADDELPDTLTTARTAYRLRMAIAAMSEMQQP